MKIINRIWLRWIAILFILNVVLAGCLPLTYESPFVPPSKATPVPTATPFVLATPRVLRYLPYEPAYPNDWLISSFQENNCGGHCWQGIRPGQTTITETRKILNQNPFVEDVKGSRHEYPTEEFLTEWFWVNEIGSGDIQYKRAKDGTITVSQIRLVLPRLIKLEDIIKPLGEPNRVFVIPVNSYNGVSRNYFTSVINDNAGYVLFNDFQPKPGFSKDTGFYLILLFESSKADEKVVRQENVKYMMDWQGYKDDAFYCRSSRLGPSCP